MENKPAMPETPIQETVSVKVTANLAADHDRYSTCTILMSMAKVTFKTPSGPEGVMYISMGGNQVDVKFGERCWRVDLTALAKAAWKADQAYLAKVK